MSEIGIYRPLKGRIVVSGHNVWGLNRFESFQLHPFRNRDGDRCWSVARKDFRRLVERAQVRFDAVTVYVDRKVSRRACDVRCQEAKSDDCECVCLGARHGNNDWRGKLELIGDHVLMEDKEVRLVYRYVKTA